MTSLITIDEHIFDLVSRVSRHSTVVFEEAASVLNLAECMKALPKLTTFIRVCKDEQDAERTKAEHRAKPSPLENTITNRLGKEIEFVVAGDFVESNLG